MNKKDKIFIAAAWPYANGSLHLGHVAGLIGADIIARYFRLHGADVLYVSGSDCHGTPIAVAAEKAGVAPAEIAAKYHKEFVETLIHGLHFSYDNYTTTTTENHKNVVQDLFLKLYNKGYIYLKAEKLPYCKKCDKFLPDRFVEGICPICGFNGARGDQCDNCGNLLNAIDLKESRCKTCGEAPEWRETEHFFLKFEPFVKELKKRAKKLGDKWRPNAKNFTLQLLEQGFHDRAITRDTDWGIEIPLPGYETKRIYVWFEAVSGYLSASIEHSNNKNEPDLWKEFWQNDKATHYYVHGKDNIPFHTIIWPAILLGAGDLHLPDVIVSSEYLTLEKKQFSKSRNWMISLPDFLAGFDADTLRYYLVVSGPENADADFSWKDYAAKVNNEMIANFGNLVNRTLTQIKKNFEAGLEPPKSLTKEDKALLRAAEDSFDGVGDLIAAVKFREALQKVFELIAETNKYLNVNEPWKRIKENKDDAGRSLFVAGQIIKCVGVLVEPFLPEAARKIKDVLGVADADFIWQYPALKTIVVGDIVPLYKKIEQVQVDAELDKLGGA